MAKATGIDLGDQFVKVVELDGSYRKTRLVRHRLEPIAPALEGEARATAVAAAVKAGMHAIRAGGDMRIGYPSREAVLRTLDLPFTGHDAIRKVIKSEVEGEIHSHAVDDMIVDFHEVGPTDGGTRVLVAAVPKAGLRPHIEALEQEGVECEIVDLDAMALYRLAHWCGAFETPAAAEAGDKLVPLADPSQKARTAVLDMGAKSTRLLLVEDGNLVDMRTLRLGTASVAEEIGREYGITLATADLAVQSCLRNGQDFDAESAPQAPVPVEAPREGEAPAEPAVPAAVAVRIPADAVITARDSYLVRVRRELLRFLASNGGTDRINAVWFTGGGSRTPGVSDVLSEVFGKTAEPLRIMERLQHNLAPEEAADLEPVLATAVGLALGPMGGPRGFNLRQEDLSFTRGFDRVKFPLAIFCMVALFTVVVWGVKMTNDLRNVEYEFGRTGPDKGVNFYGMLSAVLPRAGSWFADSRYIDSRDSKKLLDEVNATEVKDRVSKVLNWLRNKVKAAQEKTGIYEDLGLESGLAVLSRFGEVLQGKEAELGRYLVTKLDLKVPSMKGQGRYLAFTIAWRTEDFRSRAADVQEAFSQDCQKPESPFQKVDTTSSAEHRIADSEQTGVKGGYWDFKILLKDSYQPFTGTPGPARIGASELIPPDRPAPPDAVAQNHKEAGR